MSGILSDAKAPLDVIAFSAISLGLVCVSSCNEEVAQAIILALMDRSESELQEPLIRFLPLGLGLLYLGKQVIATRGGSYRIQYYFPTPCIVISSIVARFCMGFIYCASDVVFQ